MSTTATDLSTPYALTDKQIAKYQRDGYIKLKNVLSKDILDECRPAITEVVEQETADNTPLEERDTFGKAFLQVGNLWEKSEKVKAFTLSERMGRIAAELMNVKGVRLYHDQALFKEASGGYTPWHADQFYWPLANDNTVTAWIPLQAVPLEMGPLCFSIGSQTLLTGRDLEISDESEETLGRTLKDYPVDESAYDLGEVSFHSGWTFHRAGPNTSGEVRAVMTVIYMEDGVRLAEPKTDFHRNDRATWMPGSQVGEVVDTPKNPIIYKV